MWHMQISLSSTIFSAGMLQCLKFLQQKSLFQFKLLSLESLLLSDGNTQYNGTPVSQIWSFLPPRYLINECLVGGNIFTPSQSWVWSSPVECKRRDVAKFHITSSRINCLPQIPPLHFFLKSRKETWERFIFNLCFKLGLKTCQCLKREGHGSLSRPMSWVILSASTRKPVSWEGNKFPFSFKYFIFLFLHYSSLPYSN